MAAFDWSYVWDIMIVSLFLFAATYLKRSIKIFQKLFIPDAIIAGFMGLLLGPQILKLINFNVDHLGNIVYHLMSVGFISLALKERKREKNNDVINTGFFIVSAYLMQGILGFGLSLIMVFTFLPNLFPAFGLLLPLGYGQGAAQAYAIGTQWESVGFLHGGNIGLSVAAMGLLWAVLGGIPLMNYLIRVKKILPSRTDVRKLGGDVPKKSTLVEINENDSVDSFSVQLFVIGVIYLVTYLFLKGASSVLANFGTFGQTFSNLLWGFSFIVATIFAIIFRGIYDRFRKKNIISKAYISDFLLERIAGGSFDYMITASIAAISITIFREYLVPSLIIGTVGGFATIAYTVFICKRIYKEDVLENILALYGTLTGIVSTGMALVKEIDPKFESSASQNLVLGSGAGLFVGFPLMLLLNVPIVGFVSHKPIYYLYTLILFALYMTFLLIFMYIKRPKKQAAGKSAK